MVAARDLGQLVLELRGMAEVAFFAPHAAHNETVDLWRWRQRGITDDTHIQPFRAQVVPYRPSAVVIGRDGTENGFVFARPVHIVENTRLTWIQTSRQGEPCWSCDRGNDRLHGTMSAHVAETFDVRNDPVLHHGLEDVETGTV